MRKQALVAGAMYAAMILSTSIWFAVAQGFMEGHDPAGMLAALQAGQGRFEWSILVGAAGFVFWVLLALTLVQLMRHVGDAAAFAMLMFVSLGAVMGLMAVAREMDALTLLRGPNGPETAREIALAMQGFRSVFVVSMVCSAAWLIPLGWLVMRCGFLPRLLGVALIAGSVFYFGNFIGPVFVADAGHSLSVDAGYQSSLVGRMVGLLSGVPSVIGEFGTCASLLVYGLRRGAPAPERPSAPGTVTGTV